MIERTNNSLYLLVTRRKQLSSTVCKTNVSGRSNRAFDKRRERKNNVSPRNRNDRLEEKVACVLWNRLLAVFTRDFIPYSIIAQRASKWSTKEKHARTITPARGRSKRNQRSQKFPFVLENSNSEQVKSMRGNSGKMRIQWQSFFFDCVSLRCEIVIQHAEETMSLVAHTYRKTIPDFVVLEKVSRALVTFVLFSPTSVSPPFFAIPMQSSHASSIRKNMKEVSYLLCLNLIVLLLL